MNTVPTIADIKRATAAYFAVPMLDLESPRRTVKAVLPRQIAMTLCRRMTPRSLPEIGRQFGKRDHTTVHHAVSKIDRIAAIDAEIGADLAAIGALVSVGGVPAAGPGISEAVIERAAEKLAVFLDGRRLARAVAMPATGEPSIMVAPAPTAAAAALTSAIARVQAAVQRLDAAIYSPDEIGARRELEAAARALAGLAEKRHGRR